MLVMIRITMRIREFLRNIKELSSSITTLNCTTCAGKARSCRQII